MNENRRLARSTTDRQIAGVCGGLAEFLNVDPALVRLLFAILILGGEGIFVYAFLWLVLPEDIDLAADIDSPVELYRSETDRVVAGVAGGIAEYFRVDANLVRALFVMMALTGGTGVLLYIVLALLIPEEQEVEKRKREEALSL